MNDLFLNCFLPIISIYFGVVSLLLIIGFIVVLIKTMILYFYEYYQNELKKYIESEVKNNGKSNNL